MKTIEERAAEYEEISGCYGCELGQVKQAFTAGAKSEHAELTRWHDPKDPPKRFRAVLLKYERYSDEDEKRPLYSIGYYSIDSYITVKSVGLRNVIGWREIHE